MNTKKIGAMFSTTLLLVWAITAAVDVMPQAFAAEELISDSDFVSGYTTAEVFVWEFSATHPSDESGSLNEFQIGDAIFAKQDLTAKQDLP
jgi:hypothetical protein